jgi:hypothetical protein
MAWILWLLAPVASTTAGALLVWWRGRRALGRTGPDHAMAQHRAMLTALARGHQGAVEPVNLVIVSDPVGNEARVAS